MPEVAVVEVPQWQGSGSATAYRLREGARPLKAGAAGSAATLGYATIYASVAAEPAAPAIARK